MRHPWWPRVRSRVCYAFTPASPAPGFSKLAGLLAAFAPCRLLLGGSYASATLPGTLTLALEVGPTGEEYGTTVAGGPIVGYSDALCVYDKDVADRLMEIADDHGFEPQAAVLGAFMSDASHSKANGLTPRAGLLCLPTLSTHGYEVMSRRAIEAVAEVVIDFVTQPDETRSGATG